MIRPIFVKYARRNQENKENRDNILPMNIIKCTETNYKKLKFKGSFKSTSYIGDKILHKKAQIHSPKKKRRY